MTLLHTHFCLFLKLLKAFGVSLKLKTHGPDNVGIRLVTLAKSFLKDTFLMMKLRNFYI